MSTHSNKKEFKDLSLLDAFLFALATENPKDAELIARTIIRRVFGWQVADIQVEMEKQYLGTRIGGKGIRLDLQVTEMEDGKAVRIYDIEPNTYEEKYLEKRSRYYLSLTDTKYLGKSKKYKELPDFFSIWILPYDPFGDNRMIYTVKNVVVENPTLVYNEGVTRVFLYTEGELGGTEEIHNLLNYMQNSNEANAVDSELQEIHSVVSKIKGDEEVGERYMTFGDVIDYEKEESYNVGLEVGLEKGLEEGSVRGFISACREFGKTDEEIINLLTEKFLITKEEAIAKLTNN